MYFVYILSSKLKQKYYIGHSANLEKRLLSHNNGSNIFTRAYRPWEIIYSESFSTKSEAWKREKQIKSYKGGRAFKALIKSE